MAFHPNTTTVNTPDSILEISCLTPKDREDLDYMLSIGVDWIALSFVQRPADIVEIKRLILEYNPSNAFPPHIMAKIEKPSVRRCRNLICVTFFAVPATYYSRASIISVYVSALMETISKRLLSFAMASVSRPTCLWRKLSIRVIPTNIIHCMMSFPLAKWSHAGTWAWNVHLRMFPFCKRQSLTNAAHRGSQLLWRHKCWRGKSGGRYCEITLLFVTMVLTI